MSLIDNSSNSPTDSFILLSSSNTSINNTLGFNYNSVENWSNPVYKSISCDVSTFNGVKNYVSSAQIQENDEGSIIAFYDVNTNIEIDVSVIQSVDENSLVFLTQNELNISEGPAYARLYRSRDITGKYPISLTYPEYINVHCREFDSNHNDCLARISMNNSSTDSCTLYLSLIHI